MSVVLYNTAHELILKVNKLYRYKVLKTVMDVHPRNLFWTKLYTLKKTKKLSSVNYDSSIYRITLLCNFLNIES